MRETDIVGPEINGTTSHSLGVIVQDGRDERHVRCGGVFNLRDLGGYATSDGRRMRWRTVFRADGLHRATAGDAALSGLGWRTLIDLRTDTEREGGFYRADGVELLHLPMLRELWDADELGARAGDATAFLAARYLEMAEQGAATIASAFTLLASPARLPIVFHCSAGKDRTGVLAALLLAAIGIADDEIAADYHLSELAMDGLVGWITAAQPESADQMAQQPKVFLECPPAAITGFLDGLRDRHTSVDGYLLDIGVRPDTLAELRTVLLEPQ